MKRYLLTLLFTLGSTTAVVAAGPPRKLNILWIIVDDMSANFSRYGETTIRTPHVDRLAREGAQFPRAYVTAPVCSPCRSALIADREPRKTQELQAILTAFARQDVPPRAKPRPAGFVAPKVWGDKD